MTDALSPSPADVVVPASALEGPLDLARLFGRADDTRPVELEVGCGKGRFLVQAARRWPERDFIALELVRGLIAKVRGKVVREGLTNVRLLPAEAKKTFAELLPAGRLSRVHVYFPDPWPKRRHAKNRLFEPPFPEHLARALAPGGEVLLATDHDPYFRGVVARLAEHPSFVRTLPVSFDEIPRGGFDAIFEAAGVPIFRGTWERVRETG